MMKRVLGSQLAAGYLVLFAGSCPAEVATDGSLGAVQALIGPDYAITSDLGQQAGSNLFHSFSVFNIATGESATFSGPDSVSNIISRVTGGTASGIDGALNSTIPGANLYLVNPSGIIFGENASINVSGSFHASTASYLSFSDGTRFDAVNTAGTVLTVAAPQAFGFLDSSPAAISVEGSTLQLDDNQTLSLVGGDINISEGLLLAPQGGIQLVSVASPGEVNVDASLVSLDDFSQWGNIQITHTGGLGSRFVFPLGIVGNLDVSGDSGGTILIRGGNFFLDNGQVFADSTAGSGALVDIRLSNELHAVNESQITVDAYAEGDGGLLRLEVPTLVLESGGRLQADNSGSGTGGVIEAHVSQSADISGQSPDTEPFIGNMPSGLFARAVSTGAGGNINLTTGNLVIADGGQIELNNTPAGGQGGELAINADNVEVGDGGLIRADTLGAGDAGTMSLNVNELSLRDGGFISSSSFGSGSAGDITINATGTVTVSGNNATTTSAVTSNAFSDGDGGQIRIVAGELVMGDIGVIESGVGDNPDVSGLAPATADTRAGSIDVTVDRLQMSGTSRISTQSENAGQAGDIHIQVADQLVISSAAGGVQSGIYSTSAGSGAGGNLTVSAGLLSMQGGTINASSADSGNGGSVTVTADHVTLSDGAQLQTSTRGTGDGGSLSVTVAGDVLMQGQATDGQQSGLYSLTDGAGNGGAVAVVADRVMLDSGAGISSESTGSGDAGNVDITAGNLGISGGTVSTDASDGDGGKITVAVGALQIERGGRVSSSTTGAGAGGQIDVQVSGNASINGAAGDGTRSGLYSSAAGAGAGGDIGFRAADITLTDRGIVTVQSSGSGNAGNVYLAASDLTVRNSAITAQATDADGGNVKIDVSGTVLLRDSEVTAAVGGGLGDGGNVNIDPEFVVLDSSRILASAIGGDGGNITIVTDHFISSADSVLDASSRLGIDGTINILSADEDIDGNLVQLPANYLNAAGLLSEPCSVRHYADRSSLTVAARPGLPAAPDSRYALLSTFEDQVSGGKGENHAAGALTIANQSGWLAQALVARAYGCSM